MPPIKAATPPPRKPRLSLCRNESGAFDLPSILVGVVVVGILTAGILAAIFGVIPFAQDKSAQQDLDAIRNAEGVSKAQTSLFKTTGGLVDAGLLPEQGKAAADVDAPGSCYAAVAKSGSGKIFFTTSATPSAEELTESSSVGCISSDQLQDLIEAVGGSDTAPGGGSSSAKAPAAVVTFMRASVDYYASTEYYESNLPDADWDAFAASEVQARYDAATKSLYTNPQDVIAYRELLSRTDYGVAELKAALDAAESDFFDSLTPDSHAAYIEALRAFHQGALDAPRLTFTSAVAGSTYSSVAAASPATSDSELQNRYANAELAYKSSQNYLYTIVSMARAGQETEMAPILAAYADYHGYRSAMDTTAAGREWYAVAEDMSTRARSKVVIDNILNRTDGQIPALVTDMRAKQQAFESTAEPAQAAANQQLYINALRALYVEAAENPPAYTDLQATAVTDTFTVPASSTDVIKLEMELPAGVSVDAANLQFVVVDGFSSSTFHRPVDGGTVWGLHINGPGTSSVGPGTHHVLFTLKDPATGLSFYHDFTIVAQ